MHIFTLVIQVAEEVAKVSGIKKILLADNAAYNGFLPGISILFYLFYFILLGGCPFAFCMLGSYALLLSVVCIDLPKNKKKENTSGQLFLILV